MKLLLPIVQIKVSIKNNRFTFTDPGETPSAETPEVDIQASSPSTHVGDTVDLHCRSNEPGAITTWTKLSGRLEANVQANGGNLRINSAVHENAGVYRCEARGYQGVYYKDYNLEVIGKYRKDLTNMYRYMKELYLKISLFIYSDSYENIQDEQPVETKTASQGSTVVMVCKTTLNEPVSYQWSKPGGALPRDVDVHSVRTWFFHIIKYSFKE